MNTEGKKSIDQLLSTLKEKLAEPGQNLMPLLAVMGRFAKYSLSNQLLIYTQRPSATKVLGYQAWRNTGFQVHKGEKGIAIYAPMRFRGDSVALESVEPEGVRIGFRVAYVFDISQVDPIDGVTGGTIAPPASTGAPDYVGAMKEVLHRGNIELAYAQQSAGSYGFTDGKRITVAQGLAPNVEMGTLIHEATHISLHFSGDRPDITTRETEAEAVAYVLCEQLGLAGTELSIDYIKAYRGNPEILESSLERIRATAQRLTNELTAIMCELSAV
jgi:antirestriction protein ArdC